MVIDKDDDFNICFLGGIKLFQQEKIYANDFRNIHVPHIVFPVIRILRMQVNPQNIAFF